MLGLYGDVGVDMEVQVRSRSRASIFGLVKALRAWMTVTFIRLSLAGRMAESTSTLV